MKTTREKVDFLMAVIARAEAKLKAIQEKCEHKVVNKHHRSVYGGYETKRYCSECNEYLGGHWVQP